MMLSWISVPPATAGTHPRFGLWRGVLLVATCLLASGLLRSFSAAVQAWPDPDDTVLNPSWFDRATIIIVALLLAEVAFLVAWLCRWRFCRPAWAGLTVIEAVIGLLPAFLALEIVWRGDATLAKAAGIMGPSVILVVVSTLLRVLFWLFMTRSSAYRVTFESRVRANDPTLAPTAGEQQATNGPASGGGAEIQPLT
ncbi:MAG: hypothetical protein ACRYF2_19120 [Janthinobacterium lividum]